MFSYGPRITRKYEFISTGCDVWEKSCERMLVCEHEADTGCNSDHNHIGMWGANVKQEALKRMFNNETGLALSGNKDWAWEHKRNVGEVVGTIPDWDILQEDEDYLIPTPQLLQSQAFKYIRYMIKGNMECVKKVKNISRNLLELACSSWTNLPANTPHTVFVTEVKRRPPPYQQLVICSATEQWLLHKKEMREAGEDPEPERVAKYICDAMRQHGKGINPHMVRDLGYAVIYDDDDYKDLVLKKMEKHFIF